MSYALNILSKIYHPSALKRLAMCNYESQKEWWQSIGDVLKLGDFRSLGQAYSAGYELLKEKYQSAPFFKNELTTRLLLERHPFNDAFLIDEFKVGEAIADVLIVNGQTTIYEIKTELDNPDRLEAQLQNYKLFAERVYLVVHERCLNRYRSFSENHGVGLIALNGESIQELEESENFTENRNLATVFSSLRRAEYSEILRICIGKLPDAPGMYFFKECVKEAEHVPVEVMSSAIRNVLKARKNRFIEDYFSKNLVPNGLAHSILALNPDRRMSESIFQKLALEA